MEGLGIILVLLILAIGAGVSNGGYDSNWGMDKYDDDGWKF